MKERRSVTRETAPGYRRADKKDKAKILSEFVRLTGYKRNYGGWLLRNWGKEVWYQVDGQRVRAIAGSPRKRKKVKRSRLYGDRVFQQLRKIWNMLDCMCGKRLAPAMQLLIPVLEKHGELDLRADVREKLMRISPATIDRLLAEEKKRTRLKGRSHTKPGSLLKHSIPIRTFAEWNEREPGFTEIDLVGHDGGDSSGEFAFTLDLTDVYSEWTEPYAVKNKARKWTLEGLKEIRTERLPFELRGIDSDNGGEFINHHLIAYCNDTDVTFTRGRAYRKNDNCYIEQKNDMVVRQYVGYLRYDTEEEVALLNELYGYLRLLVNLYYPSAKLIERKREGSKIIKRYDTPKTPCQRLLDCEKISEEQKEWLRQEFEKYNPMELRRNIERIQDKLLRIANTKRTARARAEREARDA